MKLHQIPTSDLLAELRRREHEQPKYLVELIPSPQAYTSPKFGIYLDGRYRDTPRGPQKVYEAFSASEQTARTLCDMLNQQAAERAAAHQS